MYRLKWVALLCALFLWALFASAVLAQGPPIVGPATASPAFVSVNAPADVLFAVEIGDERVIPDGVSLLRTDALGRTLSIAGRMLDNGAGGDAVSGDRTFSFRLTVNETAAAPTYYRVSAAFKGILQRVLSPVLTMPVRGRPGIAIQLSPPASSAGWNNTPVTVTFVCTPGGSPIVSCPPQQVVTSEVTSQTVSGTAIDASGGTTPATSVPISIDRTAPTVNVLVAPPANGNGWHKDPVTVQFTCDDALSGIAACPPLEVIGSEGANQTVSRTVADRAGNATSVVTGPFSIDRTPPTISVGLSPFSPDGVYSGPVTATYTCSDALSGTDGCPPAYVFTTAGVGLTVTGTVQDRAGNVATVTTPPVTIRPGDPTLPRIRVTLSPRPNGSGWNNTPLTAHFECDTELVYVQSICPVDTVISTEGANQTVSGSVTENGKTATVTSLPFSIDLTPPTASVVLSPAANANGWAREPVTVVFACGDSLSGVAECPREQVVSTEGANQSVNGTVVDRAGNVAVVSAPVSIDRTPPVIALSSPSTGTNVFTPSLTLSGLFADALSGVAAASCNGAPATITAGAFTCVITLDPGANTVTASGVDRAGNAAETSLDFTYTRVPLITIQQPANLTYTSISPTTVTGTVDDKAATVTVNSIQAAVVNGVFSVALPLAEGPNTVTATATSGQGAVGTATLTVTLDTTPPRVTVTSPQNEFVTTESSVSVAGIVNDIVVGTVNAEQAGVTVNGVVAQVANRTFLADTVALALGSNVINIVGRDRVGNQGTTQITVVREAVAAQPRIQTVAGNGQTGVIRSMLPVPLRIALVDALGTPVANKPVIFKVTQNDGLIASDNVPAPTVIATTDAQGQAEVQWTLGGRAGAGGNTVEAYSVGFEGTAIFNATGNQGAAGKIVVDTGNNQIGPIGQRLPRPFIAVVVDDGNNRLAGVSVTFTVSEGGGDFDGQPTLTVVSDPDGRVAGTLTLGTQEGTDNNIVSATFESNQGFPAAFTASGRAPGDPARTTITGVVLDNSNIPIPGVTVRAVQTEVLHANGNAANAVTPVQTDAQGQFTIQAVPVGFVELIVDGSTAAPAGTYPTLDYDMVTVAGQVNTVGQPIFLLPIPGDEDHQKCVALTDGVLTGGGTLTIPEAPGFSLTFAPGQVTFPGGSKTGCISVTVVNREKVPMSPGFGQQPRFIVTIQPAGAMFNPPAAITLPNVDGLKAREVTEMYSFDHDIGSFVAIGTGIVSEDGLVIRSDVGAGVLKAGWHCGGNPNAIGTTANCGQCNWCQDVDGGGIPGGACVRNPSMLGRECALNGPSLPSGLAGYCETSTLGPLPLATCVPGCRVTLPPPFEGFVDVPKNTKGEFPLVNPALCLDRRQNEKVHEYDGCSVPEELAELIQSLGLFPHFTGDVDEPMAGVRFSNQALTGACDIHDKCYQTCSTSADARSSCDRDLRTNAKAACQNRFPELDPVDPGTTDPFGYTDANLLYECNSMANTYHGFLAVFGGGPFSQRQSQYCKCCP